MTAIGTAVDLDQLLHRPQDAVSVPPSEARKLLPALVAVVEGLRLAASGGGIVPPPDRLLTIAEAAPMLKMSPTTLYNRRARRRACRIFGSTTCAGRPTWR